MKHIVALLFLFFGISGFLNSQNFTGNWNIVSLESNGTLINLPSTTTTTPNINFDHFFSSGPAEYNQIDGRYLSGSGICNTFTSYFEIETNAIALVPYFETSDNMCNTTEEIDFENLLFSILQEPGSLNYSFSNNLYNLSFTNSTGDVINLNRDNAPSNLLAGEWFLHHIWEFDFLFENTFDPSLNIVFSDENINGQGVFDGSSTCNGFNGSYDNPIQSSSFIKRNIGWTLIPCNSDEELYFEEAYFRFFDITAEDIFTFEITGNGANAILTLHNGNDTEIQYGRQALSISSFKQPKTKLITNVAENRLQLISDNIGLNSYYQIYDTSGRLITSSYLNQTKSILTHTLESGFYLLRVINKTNQEESFKFFKN